MPLEQPPFDKAKTQRKRTQKVQEQGHFQIVNKKDKRAFEVAQEAVDFTKALVGMEPYFRHYAVVTVIYLVQPHNKKMLSEDLIEVSLGGNQQHQDVIS